MKCITDAAQSLFDEVDALDGPKRDLALLTGPQVFMNCWSRFEAVARCLDAGPMALCAQAILPDLVSLHYDKATAMIVMDDDERSSYAYFSELTPDARTQCISSEVVRVAPIVQQIAYQQKLDETQRKLLAEHMATTGCNAVFTAQRVALLLGLLELHMWKTSQ